MDSAVLRKPRCSSSSLKRARDCHTSLAFVTHSNRTPLEVKSRAAEEPTARAFTADKSINKRPVEIASIEHTLFERSRQARAKRGFSRSCDLLCSFSSCGENLSMRVLHARTHAQTPHKTQPPHRWRHHIREMPRAVGAPHRALASPVLHSPVLYSPILRSPMKSPIASKVVANLKTRMPRTQWQPNSLQTQLFSRAVRSNHQRQKRSHVILKVPQFPPKRRNVK